MLDEHDMRALDEFSSSSSHAYGNPHVTPAVVSFQTFSMSSDPSIFSHTLVFSTLVWSRIGGDTNDTGYAYVFL